MSIIYPGCFASMYPVVMVDLMGLDVIEYTLGLGMASTSIAFLVASPLSGKRHTDMSKTGLIT